MASALSHTSGFAVYIRYIHQQSPKSKRPSGQHCLAVDKIVGSDLFAACHYSCVFCLCSCFMSVEIANKASIYLALKVSLPITLNHNSP
jgi:hypothetical protein